MQLPLEGSKEISPPESRFPQMLEGSNYSKRRSDVSMRVVEGETVIFDHQGGLIHQLNHTASFIWERCDGKYAIADIVQQLAQQFNVDYETATKDVTAVIVQLQKLNLLESC